MRLWQWLLVMFVTTPALSVTNVQFLHVGKAAGSTVQDVLNRLTKPGGGKCLDVTGVHMHRPHSYGSKIVICTRDPLDRVVSAFNYRHPYRGFPTIHDKAISGGAGHPDATEIALYQCFNRVNEFAEALSSHGHCADVARSVFHCARPHRSNTRASCHRAPPKR